MSDVFSKLSAKYPELDVCLDEIRRAAELMEASFISGGKTLVCGNGGSAADAEHIVGELMKSFISKRPVQASLRNKLLELFPAEGAFLADRLQEALPAISLVSQSALATAFINDVAAEMVFAQQVYGYGRPGDVLIGLSTSGNSANVVCAMQVAKACGLHTIALTGRSGGRLKDLCEVAICVPWDSTPDIQERHVPIYHAICIAVEEVLFGL